MSNPRNATSDRKHRFLGRRWRPYKRIPAMERFEKFVQRSDGCWEWAGAVTPHGYGEFNDGTPVPMGAHRFAYLNWRGPIPADRELDHLCRNRRCVNPDHLEIVTTRENSHRGVLARLGPTCPQGHERPFFTGKDCPECSRVRARATYYARQASPRVRDCIHGHGPYVGAGCRPCGRESLRRSRARRAVGHASAQ